MEDREVVGAFGEIDLCSLPQTARTEFSVVAFRGGDPAGPIDAAHRLM